VIPLTRLQLWIQWRALCARRKITLVPDMPDAPDQRILDALLDSWDRNNSILVNLLAALPEGGLEARATEGSSSVAA
jgi:hypothetical protein